MTTIHQPDQPRYSRVLLKVTGEALSPGGTGGEGMGIGPDELKRLADEAAAIRDTGARLAIVTGGGNIIRGAPLANASVIERHDADVMGMLGTVINAIAIAAALRHHDIPAHAVSALGFHRYITTHDPTTARHHFDEGTVIVFGGGVGNPYFSTDTTAALRAIELQCDIVLKATKVDGVYTADPKANPDARRYTTLNYDDAISNQLAVLDLTAFALCKQHDMPLAVFDFAIPGNAADIIADPAAAEQRATLVGGFPTRLA